MIGDASLPPLLFLHGYGGSGLLLYKLFKPLAAHFRAYFIDLIGMGSSSRPSFVCRTATDCDDYMVGMIEAWCQAIGELKQPFYLVGHSYGGYLAG